MPGLLLAPNQPLISGGSSDWAVEKHYFRPSSDKACLLTGSLDDTMLLHNSRDQPPSTPLPPGRQVGIPSRGFLQPWNVPAGTRIILGQLIGLPRKDS